MEKKLILFIHGLGGSAEGTWKQFPKLLRDDADLVSQYEVKTFEYPTAIVGSKPSLATCATILKTEIENRHGSYSDIALIAHSQGGLLARYYIAERINSKQPLPVKRLLTFATPHQGSGLATLLKWAPFTSQQTEDLDPNSEFMRALGIAWGQAKADTHVLTKYVVAAGDAIVGQVSAIGSWSPGYEVVGGDGHLAIVKPETADHTSFLIAKKFLLEDGLQPGGVEADYTAPLLSLPFVPREDPEALSRFTFSTRALPFIGREAEERILTDFLEGSDQMFRWMVMHGSGGVGKSRLALELCLAVRNEWHAGFLQDEEADPVWGKWQPLMPTLIVIDPAARDTVRTGKVLRALAGRGPAYGTARLAAPVRVLLVERISEGVWLEKILEGDETKKKQLELARAPNLPLTTINDPWPIFEFVLKQIGKPLPDKAKTLATLAEIDSERRPLFAYFQADLIARGVDIRHVDAAGLLDQVIKHGRESYWKPAGALPKDERLLAIATMAGGLPVSAVKGVKDELLPSWDIDHHPKVFLAMTGRKSGQAIAPLAPDIVGEHFALACLKQDELSDEDRARFCDLAWRLSPLGMAQFMLRAHHDLPAHPMLHWVRKSPASEGGSQRQEPPLWEQWARGAHNLMNEFLSSNPVAAQALLKDMRGVADKREEASLWEWWASAAFKLTNDLGPCEPVAARALLDDMRDVAASRDEALLWKQWAIAAHNLILDLRSRDPVAARALLDDMRGVAATRDEAALWDLWVKAAAATLSVDLQSRDPVAARTLLDDMHDVAAARDEALLWEPWAIAAHNMILDLRSRDRVAALALLNDMCGVAAARDEAALWDLWVKAAAATLQSPDVAAACALLDDMRGVAAARDETFLWEPWTKAAFSLTDALRSHDAVAARTLLDKMRDVADTHDETALWEWWAKAAVNLTIGALANDPKSRDPVAERALLDHMRDVAKARDKSLLWEMWAMAALNLTYDLLSRDPVAAQALLDDMRDVAVTRDNSALWEQWTKAAYNLVSDLRSRDAVAARTLLDDMGGVADARNEAQLWEWWARASTTLILDLGSRDPAASRALVDDMLKAVAKHPGDDGGWQPKIRDLVFHAASTLTEDFARRDPGAARAFCADVLGLPEEMLQKMRLGD